MLNIISFWSESGEQKQRASPIRVKWFKIYNENAKSNFSCFSGATTKKNKEGKSENQKLLDCEMEFNRRSSFNSENAFFLSSELCCFAIRCKNVQLALAQTNFLPCNSQSLCMNDDIGPQIVPEKLLHFRTLFPIVVLSNLFSMLLLMLRQTRHFIFICAEAPTNVPRTNERWAKLCTNSERKTL